MQPELALLVREFVRRTPDAYKDFRIPDPVPGSQPPAKAPLLTRLLAMKQWRLLPTH